MLYKHVSCSLDVDGEIEIPITAICVSIKPMSNFKSEWMRVSWLEPIIKETIIHVSQ